MKGRSFSPYQSEQDKRQRIINDFATQSFRNQADRDYIAARLACRHELIPQFLWASQQAIEKYLKAILLYNRIVAKTVGHDLLAALRLTSGLTFRIDLSERTREFIDHLATYGEYRYIDVPYWVDGHLLVDLDLAVWELRRYCQVLDVFGKALPAAENRLLAKAQADVKKSDDEPRHKFRIHGGFLEKILEAPGHPCRDALVWQNASYGVRSRRTVRVARHTQAENPILVHFPEVLDELLKYIFMPKKVADQFRSQLLKLKGDSK